MRPSDATAAALAADGAAPDAAQLAALAKLDALAAAIDAGAPTFFGRLRDLLDGPSRHPPLRGLYLWGGVGRGKTMLMDRFFAALRERRKRRSHFHRFMREVHAELKALGAMTDPLDAVAARLAARARVICFDEFHVADIADAMILGTLFERLFARGVTLVATSNVAPAGLYRDGLQRARFLPAIALLEQHCEVLAVDGGADYRLRALTRAELFHAPLDANADAALASAFRMIAGGDGVAGGALVVEGRPIPTRRRAEGVVWFEFAALCGGPRAAADYIDLACENHTVLIAGVPAFDAARDDEAKRFIALVDEFYDRAVKLVLSAAAPIGELYRGERLAFEFERTRSRLLEMQSAEYLARPHRP
jgi:cell division protein ZapE